MDRWKRALGHKRTAGMHWYDMTWLPPLDRESGNYIDTCIATPPQRAEGCSVRFAAHRGGTGGLRPGPAWASPAPAARHSGSTPLCWFLVNLGQPTPAGHYPIPHKAQLLCCYHLI